MSRRRLPLSPLARKAVADVTRRKGRSAMVILGILIGVAGMTAINVSAGALGAAFQYSANETARANISIAVPAIDPALDPQLQAVPNVKTVQVWSDYSSRWKISAPPGHVNMTIYGADDLGQLAIDPIQLTSGILPGAGQILMESSDQSLQAFAVGETITVDSIHGPAELQVSGLCRTLGTTSAAIQDTAVAYVNTATLQALSGQGEPNLISVLVEKTALNGQTALALAHVLKSNHVAVTDLSEQSDDFTLGPAAGLFDIMRVLSLIALLLTAFLIINTITTLVAEQTGLIGTMRAIGATRATVMRGYLISVFIYALIGTGLGLALGIYGGYRLTSFLVTIITLDLGPFTVDPGILVLSLGIGLGIPLVAAVLPLRTGTRIPVHEALAAYGVSGVEPRHPGWVSRRLTWLPQTTLLGIRAAFRKRGRAILTLLALSLAATSFLAIQTATYSVNQDLGQIFSQYDFDIALGVAKPQPAATFERELLALPNVGRVERFEQTEQPTRWGNVILTATDPNPQLYQYALVKGRLFADNAPGVMLLSQRVAAKTGLGIGDSMTFTSLNSSVTWRIIGIVHDQNGGLGTIGTVFTTIDNLHAFEDMPASVGALYMIQATDRSQPAINALAEQLDTTLSDQGLDPSISTAQQQNARNQSQFQILYVLLYVVAALVALIGALGLFNTLTASVLERRREIGMLRAMGATSWQVAGVFWIEGLSLAALAWLIGVVVGIPAAYGFVWLLNAVLLTVPFAFNPLALLVMLLFVMVIASLATILPALSASRMRVAQALRY